MIEIRIFQPEAIVLIVCLYIQKLFRYWYRSSDGIIAHAIEIYKINFIYLELENNCFVYLIFLTH